MQMKKLVIFAMVASIATPVFADTYVQGYTRRDGTYVRPHIRSSPDGSRANNYGPSDGSSYGMMSPYGRDHDNDGMQNMYDSDDDNDGYGDNRDSSQYGRLWPYNN